MDRLRHLVGLALISTTLIAMNGCVPMTNSQALNCDTESGGKANVREIYGSWKMLSGYPDGAKTPTELEHNYQVLVVQTGGGLCRVAYQSQSPINTVLLSTYVHNVNAKKLALTVLFPSGYQDQAITATYSFSGTCGDPRMTLRYSTGAVENYAFRGKDIGDGCQF